MAFAGPFTIDVSSYGTTNTTYQAEIDALFNQLETTINNDLPDADVSTYLKGMANSSVMAGKGVGTDYANDVDLFVIGGSVGIGADLGNNSFSSLMKGDVDENQIRGVGFSPSIMVGTNLALFNLPKLWVIDFDKMHVYANYFSMDLDDFADDITGDVKSFGFHAKYRIHDGTSFIPLPLVGGLLRWGGLNITTGYEFTSFNAKFTKTYTGKSTTATVNSVSVPAFYTGTAVAGADVATHSIPIEISTNAQFLYFLSLYGGLGTDISFGKAETLASVNGNVSADTSSISGFTGNPTATASLNLGSEDSPTLMMFRYFVGAQINLPLVKTFVQLDRTFGKDLIAATAGVRLAW